MIKTKNTQRNFRDAMYEIKTYLYDTSMASGSITKCDYLFTGLVNVRYMDHCKEQWQRDEYASTLKEKVESWIACENNEIPTAKEKISLVKQLVRELTNHGQKDKKLQDVLTGLVKMVADLYPNENE